MTLTVAKSHQIKLTLQRRESSRVGAQPDSTEAHWPSTNFASPLRVRLAKGISLHWSSGRLLQPPKLFLSLLSHLHGSLSFPRRASGRNQAWEIRIFLLALCSLGPSDSCIKGAKFKFINQQAFHSLPFNGSLLVQKQGWSQWICHSHFLLASFLTLKKGRDLELCELVGKYCGQAPGITACVYHIIYPSREGKLSHIQKRWNSDSEEFSNLLGITEIVRNWVKIYNQVL